MPIYSMTGFASGQQPLPEDSSDADPARSAAQVTLELRTVNSRFLDMVFHLPDELRACEPALRQLLAARLQRGKVEARAGLRRQERQALATPSPALLQQLAQIQSAVRSRVADAAAFSMADVLQLAAGGTPPDHAQLEATLLALADSVTEELLQARAAEGERLRQLLLDRCQQLRQLAADAAPLVPEIIAAQKQRFMARWQDALSDAGGATVSSEAAQDRALAEAAAFALRTDVAEELDRLGAHLDEIERLLGRGGTLGKRLGFLIQELHREANTLGAKSASLALSRTGVNMKVLIEQMREQVQNLE
ncbi:MAG: YicC/YloC family endoribonuclease [Ottowia sp.]|nr:YicC family protein [Ottowia sp.]